MGVACTRNRLLDIASGEWVVFIDADDYVSDDYLAGFAGQIARHPETDVFVCNMYYVWGDRVVAVSPFKGSKNDYCHELLRKRYWKAPSGLCAKALRRSLIERNHVRCEEHFNLGEDLFFLVVLLFHANNIGIDNRPRYFYRKNVENSITDGANYKKDEISCYLAIIAFIRSRSDAREYEPFLNEGKMRIRQKWYLSVRRRRQGDVCPYVFNDVRYKGLHLLDKVRLFCINHDRFNVLRAINRIARVMNL